MLQVQRLTGSDQIGRCNRIQPGQMLNIQLMAPGDTVHGITGLYLISGCIPVCSILWCPGLQWCLPVCRAAGSTAQQDAQPAEQSEQETAWNHTGHACDNDTMNTILFVVSAPSGAGKSSLLQALLAADDRLSLSISHTTRPARPGEQSGVHYHFVDVATFRQLRQQGHFIESAEVFGQHYGTSGQAMQHQLCDTDVALEIDWQGARAIRARFPTAVTIFIAPPGLIALQERLVQRAQDDPQIIRQRMQQAKTELSHYHEYDYLLINETFATTLRDLQHILAAERLRLAQNPAHPTAQQVRHMLQGDIKSTA